MPQSDYVPGDIGNQDDSIVLTLNGEQLLYVESWTVEESVFSQPMRWSCRIGFDSVALEQYAKYQPHSRFQLQINGATQAIGYIDKRALEMRGAGSVLTISGRDALAPLHDSFVMAARGFADQTYSALVKAALADCGLDPTKLVLSNDNNRSSRVGLPIQVAQQPEAVNAVEQQPIGNTIGADALEMQSKCGDRWLEFLRHHLDRAGLTLWAGADGTFVLSAPNVSQSPTYKLYRQIEADYAQTNVLGWRVSDDCTSRHTHAIVYGRGGGRKAGRVKARSHFVDQEMVDYGYGSPVVVGADGYIKSGGQPLAFRARGVQTGAQAEYFARRKLMEERRAGWLLEYTIAGHTLPVANGGGALAVVVPDTILDIADDLTGVFGLFYVEGVTRTLDAAGGTTTTLRLMRPHDLTFLGALTAKSTPGAIEPQQKPSDAGFTVYFNCVLPPES